MTNIQYKVDDMTGAPMDVKQWVDTEVSDGSFIFTQTILKYPADVFLSVIFWEKHESCTVKCVWVVNKTHYQEGHIVGGFLFNRGW